jgi:excinuclease UvrABC nuclease subunit
LEPRILHAPFDLAALPDAPAVFLVFAESGEPYLARTALLRRRLARLLNPRSGQSRLLSLAGIARRVEFYPVASRLASALLLYRLARVHFPGDYAARIRLRPAPFVKVTLTHVFPRTMVTTKLGGSGAFLCGPFRTRASAERFEQEVLDLFQVRRCQEDFVPSPEHPGCVYGEMARCLRPCQQVVGPEEYRSEVLRLTLFLSTGGRSLAESVAAARDRFSEELQFEEAERQHQRLTRIEDVLKARDDLACPLDKLNGVAVLPSPESGCVELLFLLGGAWCEAVEFRIAASGVSVSLDRRLRELAAALIPPRLTVQERTEHIALLSRWYYSSWRDADWIAFDSLDALPYRKLVRAISKTATGTQASLF